MSRLKTLTRVLVSGALLCVLAHGQGTVTSGTIRGTIIDPSGAVVPNAQVTVTSPQTGLTRQVTASGTGTYSLSDLPPGTYTITINANGFKQVVLRNVTVNVSSVTDENTQLQVGNQGEQVTVEAEAVRVQTTSAAVGEVITGEQATELPLNGSNFVELTQLQPGVSRTNTFNASNKGLLGGVDFSVNGNPTTNNLFLIDGANNNDVGSNRTILMYPSIDAIAEFKMLRNSYGPEYGQASGAVVSIATKSGTNQFHGSLNYFGRNDKLSAEDPFAKVANAAVAAASGGKGLPNNGKDKLRRNDIIYSLGGPIKKDKIFFFWSQEFNREIRGFTRQSCVPSAAERAGDFSQDFTNGKDQCGGSQPTIPVADQAPGNPFKFAHPSPAGMAILAQLPLPNAVASAGTNFNNWFVSTPSPINFREENARVDFNVTSGELVTMRYTQDHWNNAAPNLASSGQGLWGEDPFPSIESSWSQPSRSAIAKLTSTLSGTLVNEAQFSYSANAIHTTKNPNASPAAAAIDQALPSAFGGTIASKGGGIPTFWGGGFGPYASYGSPNIWSIAGYDNNMALYQVRDDLSKVIGNHSIKTGAYLSWNSKNENQYGGQNGLVIGSAEAWNTPANSNWSAQTGNDLANLLWPAERFATNEQNINPQDQARWRDYEFYVGDTWKVKPTLTVEYGFRWSFLREPFAENNAVGSFSPSAYNPANAFVVDQFGNKQPNLCNGLTVPSGTNWCSALSKITGIPYSGAVVSKYGRALIPNNNHLIAPRLGISWDPFGNGKTAIRTGVGQFYQRERVSLQIGLNNALPITVTASNGGPGPNCLTCDYRFLDVAPAPNTILWTGTVASKGVNNKEPNSWQWNFMVEQELARDTALEVGYIGNKGLHLTTQYDLNTILPQNRPQAAYASGAKQQSFRPFAEYGNIWTGDRIGYSTYHALQALFRTKFPNIVTLQAAFTWSHSISNVDLANANGLGNNPQDLTDIYHPGLDKGNSSINRPKMFVANAIWYLPKFNGMNPIGRGILGGWELATIATLEDGNSFTVFNANSSGTGVQTGLFGTGGGNNARPLIVPGVGCNSNVHGNQIINPAAFTMTGFIIGQVPQPNLEPRGYCRGPSYQDVDLAIYKNFKVKERVNIQFRMDAFNSLNHVNYAGNEGGAGGVSNEIGTALQAFCGTAGGQNNGCSATNNVVTSSSYNATSSFGRATSALTPRQFQYGLRITF